MTVLVGDTRHVLATLPADSVNCCVTSPPYWGLRDYGTARWEGGDEGCDHVVSRKPPTVTSSSTLGYPADGGARRIAAGNTYHEAYTKTADETCQRCGARRIDSQIGLESTPEAYVAELVAVFREVRRVLREDGTVWVNLGDSYAAQRGGTQMPAETLAGGVGGRSKDLAAYRGRRPDVLADAVDREARAPNQARLAHRNASRIGLKHKDLVGIPWRVAFALQSDGWYLRSDIIWSKPNPMPESVTDRPTKSHEYVFLLTKSARYWYDAGAVREPDSGLPSGNGMRGRQGGSSDKYPESMTGGGGSVAKFVPGAGRNARTVWTIATQPFSGAHFATMPPALAERCIKAGCPEGGTVLDPFGGAGTTGLVADRIGRNAVLIELNPVYADMARKRIANDAPLITEVA